MKLTLLLFILFINSIVFNQVELELNLTGKPDYRRLVTESRAFQIYSKGAEKVFYMTPASYFHLSGANDTLEFTITGDSLDFNIELKNDIKGFTVQMEKDVLVFKSGENRIEFELKISRSKENTEYSTIKEGILLEDKELGMVITENRFTRYAQVNLTNEIFNIAILDRNTNGNIDTNDLISLSFDEFFTSKQNIKASFLNKETIIKVESYFYKVSWTSGYKLKIEQISEQEETKLTLNNLLPDIILSDGNVLSNLVQQKEYTLLSFWSEYSPNCIATIKELNKLNNVIGIHLNEGVDVNNYSLSFLNYLVTEQQLDDFGVNGYPYFIVVNKDLEKIATYQFFNEIPDIFKKH